MDGVDLVPLDDDAATDIEDPRPAPVGELQANEAPRKLLGRGLRPGQQILAREGRECEQCVDLRREVREPAPNPGRRVVEVETTRGAPISL